jgi:diacylglycerol kinase (ATP)
MEYRQSPDVHTSLISSQTENSTLMGIPVIFIFVNPTSGGNRASVITSIGAETLRFRGVGVESKLFIFDIRQGKSGDKPGFVNLREQLERRKYITEAHPLRVVVAGGDGTVMWTIQEAIAHGIDTTRIAFGVIPYGTGNDFARALGWGGSSPGSGIFDDGMKGFKSMVKDWLEADVNLFDIWEVAVTVAKGNGHIKQVKNKQKIIMESSVSSPTSKSLVKLVKPMCNYFSIGIESRIGLGFDKKRTKSQFLNKAVYGWEGLKKIFTSTPKVTDVVASLSAHDKTIFSTDDNEGKPAVKLVGRPVSLIFMNINSFAGGCNLWEGAMKPGLTGMDKTSAIFESSQSCGDGKLEVLTYRSLPGLSMEQAKGTFLSGNGCRIAQEEGPVQLRFKPDLGSKRTYMQIDGEFFTLDNPESVDVAHKIAIRVLAKPAPKSK